VREMSTAEANALLAKWHYLGPVRGIISAFGHNEGCLVFTNPRSRLYEAKMSPLRVIELARMVGSPHHRWAMSSLMAVAMRFIRGQRWDWCVTYADPQAGHTGAVYRAANWVDAGLIGKDGHPLFFVDGQRMSPRTLYDRHGTQSVPYLRRVYGERLITRPKPLKRRFHLDLRPIRPLLVEVGQ
jgi:hypothetical protein